MEPFFADYADRLKEMMGDLEQALTGLPVEALDWSPGPELNSLTVLSMHAAGATRFWIGDVAGQDASARERAREFQSQGQDEAALRARLAEVLDHSLHVLQGLTLADLSAARVGNQTRGECTVGWALLRALDHLSEHVGHAQMTRQLWMQQQTASRTG